MVLFSGSNRSTGPFLKNPLGSGNLTLHFDDRIVAPHELTLDQRRWRRIQIPKLSRKA